MPDRRDRRDLPVSRGGVVTNGFGNCDRVARNFQMSGNLHDAWEPV
jgi:hypothetical protein